MKKLFLIIWVVFSTIATAQNKSIKGNGSVATQKLSIAAFNSLTINADCEIHLQSGAMPMAEISGDANVISKFDFKAVGNQLTIQIKKGYWIENGKPQIFLQTPFIKELKTDGHQTGIGKITIENIDVQQFKLNVLYGDIWLEGQAEELIVKSTNKNSYQYSSHVNAENLKAKKVDVSIVGKNSAAVFASGQLNVFLQNGAILTISGNPKNKNLSGDARYMNENTIASRHENGSEEMVAKPSKKLNYISFTVKNNSPERRNFIIKGPSENAKGYSYGFPMMPYAIREKKVPVGSEIWVENGQKLITINAADNGQELNLFN